MYKVKTTVDVEMAHRLYDVNTYSQECRKNLHGHSFSITIIVGRDKLNQNSMVIDFKLLKEIIRSTVESRFDHSTTLNSKDPIAHTIYENCDKVNIIDEKPTAEWLCQEVFNMINPALKSNDPELKVCEIDVQETKNNIAILELD